MIITLTNGCPNWVGFESQSLSWPQISKQCSELYLIIAVILIDHLFHQWFHHWFVWVASFIHLFRRIAFSVLHTTNICASFLSLTNNNKLLSSEQMSTDFHFLPDWSRLDWAQQQLDSRQSIASIDQVQLVGA